jgi:hypothetical protein
MEEVCLLVYRLLLEHRPRAQILRGRGRYMSTLFPSPYPTGNPGYAPGIPYPMVVGLDATRDENPISHVLKALKVLIN